MVASALAVTCIKRRPDGLILSRVPIRGAISLRLAVQLWSKLYLSLSENARHGASAAYRSGISRPPLLLVAGRLHARVGVPAGK